MCKYLGVLGQEIKYIFTGSNGQENLKTTVLRNPGVKERVLFLFRWADRNPHSHVPGTVLSTLEVLSHLIFTISLQGYYEFTVKASINSKHLNNLPELLR